MKSLIRLLIRKKIKLSITESCTGGLLASTITSISGASKIFNLGLITYSNKAKIKILKVNKSIIKKYGAVSYECCYAMVNNYLKFLKPVFMFQLQVLQGQKVVPKKNLLA